MVVQDNPVEAPLIMVNLTPRRLTEIEELGCKLAAKVLLSGKSRKIVVPSCEEWIGINLLELDYEHR